MQEHTLEAMVKGCLTFWDVGITDHATLLESLTALDMERFCPGPRSENEALKQAMTDYGVTQKKIMPTNGHPFDLVVEPLESRGDGLCLAKRTRGQTDNERDLIFSAKIGQSGLVMITNGYAPLMTISESYIAYRKQISGGSVGRSLVEILGHLHGTCVRTIGGVYYLPDDAVEGWDDVVTAYESAGSKNTVHRARIVMDESTARTVRAAITKELVTAAGKLAQEIADNEFGADAIERRLAKAQDLQERADRYSEILNDQLAECRAIIDVAKAAAGASQAVKDDNAVFNEMYV